MQDYRGESVTAGEDTKASRGYEGDRVVDEVRELQGRSSKCTSDKTKCLNIDVLIIGQIYLIFISAR